MAHIMVYHRRIAKVEQTTEATIIRLVDGQVLVIPSAEVDPEWQVGDLLRFTVARIPPPKPTRKDNAI